MYINYSNYSTKVRQIVTKFIEVYLICDIIDRSVFIRQNNIYERGFMFD